MSFVLDYSHFTVMLLPLTMIAGGAYVTGPMCVFGVCLSAGLQRN